MSNNTNKTVNNSVNGFDFNSVGDLIATPKDPSLAILEDTLSKLHKQKESISASRIQFLINTY